VVARIAPGLGEVHVEASLQCTRKYESGNEV
jgi:hypothetical protein